MKREISKRERRLAKLTALFLGIAAGYVYVIEPTYLRWSLVRTEASRLANEQARLTTLMENRDQIESSYSAVSGAVQIAQSENDLTIALLREVEAIAKRTSVIVMSVKPMRRISPAAVERIEVEFVARSEAHQFVELLQRMQSTEHLILVEELQLTVGGDSPPVAFTMVLSKMVRVEAI